MTTITSYQEELQFHSKLFNCIPDPIVATDKFLNITSFNKYAEEVFIWKPEEVIGKSIRKVVGSNYPDLTPFEVAEMLLKNGVWKGEILALRKDGERFSAYISINTITDDAGNLTGTIAVIRDLSSQKKQEKEIESLASDLKKMNQQLEKKVLEKTEELTSIFESITDGVVAYDKDWNYTYANRKAAEAVNSSPESLIGRNVWKLFPQIVGSSLHASYLKSVREQRVIRSVEYVEQFKKWFEGVMYPSPGGLVAYFQDITDRKNAEIARDKSQELYRTLVEAAQEGILQIDENNIITFANSFTASLLACRVEDLLNKNVLDIVGEHNVEVVLQHIKRKKEGVTQQFELRIFNAQGKTIDTLIQSRPLFRAGNYAGSVSTILDITERKRAEEELHYHETKYRSLVESSLSGILLTVKDGQILAANKAACEMFEMTEAEILKAGRRNLVDETDPQLHVLLEERERTGFAKGEINFKRKDGSKFPAEISSVVFTDVNGEEKTSMIIRDITERKLAEADNLFKAQLLNTIQQSVVATDKDGVVTYWNNAAEKLYGWKAEEAVGKKIEDTTFSNKNKEEAVDTIGSLKQLPTQENEYWVNRKDGSVFPVSISNSPIYDSQNQLAGFIAISTDITERKKSEQQINDSERKYRQIVETAQEGIWMMDENGITTFVNQKMCELLEYTAEEILGKTSLSYRRDGNREEFFHRIEMRKQGLSETHEAVFYSKSRKEIYTKISTNPLFDSAGKFIGSLAMVTDITNLKIAEDEREFERRNKESLINSTQDLIWSVSSDYKLISANKGFFNEMSKTLGINLKVGDDLMLEQFIPVNFLNDWKSFYNKALSGDIFTKEILSPVALDNTRFWSEIIFNPIYKDDQVVAVACFSRNITEKKIAEEKLKESEAHLAEAQRLADMGSWNLDVLLGKLTWSDQLYAVFDTDSETFDGTHTRFLEMIADDDRELALQTRRHTQQTGEPFAITYRIITSTGKTRTIQEHGYGVKDNDGKVIRLFGTAQNITDRVQAEDENRFHAQLLNTIGQAAIATDPSGVISFWNKTAEVMYGWSADEAIGKQIVNLTPTEQTKEQSGQIMQQLNAGKTWEGEFIVQKKDASTFPVFVTNVPFYDQQHRFKGVIGVSVDITERKKAEHALQVSQARYCKAQSLGKMGHWELNLKTDQLNWSDEVYNIFGVDKSVNKINSDTYLNLVHPDDLEPFNIAMADLLGGNNVDFSHRAIKKDGTICYVHGKGELEYNDQGEPTCVTGTIQDITQQKRSEIELREAFVQQLLFASIVRSSNDAIISKTLDGIITSWNRGAETIFEYTEDEALGKTTALIIPADLINEEVRITEKIKSGEHLQHYETERLTKSGKRIKVSLTISPIYNGSGIIMGASVIARNITEQKKAEQQLVQSEEKYRLLFEKSPQPMWIFDIQTLKFLEVNLAAIEHYGYSRQEFLQMTVYDVRPMESNPALKDLSNLDYSKTYSNFSIHRKKNGELIKVQISVSNIEYENRKATLVLLIDRTEQERTRKELLNINSQLRELTAHLHNIREEERTHIAREIHDELGQQLSALKMDIEWVISKMPRQEGLIEERVADLLSLIGQTVNSVRRISTNLRPAILDDLGLLAALEWQSSEAEKRSGININLTCNLTDVTLPLPITTGLFRIYQEALTNVVRHSSAKQVDAKLIVSENMIILQIADNGKGIVTEPSGKTFGLIGMKERAYILNGNIEIQSKPGKGTTIMVSIPHHSSN